jgi:predicted amidohydrolase
MRLAAIQFAPALHDLHATLGALQPHLDAACEADLIVLPELCNSGYNLPDRPTALAAAEPVAASAFLDHLAAFCAQHHCEIVTGFCEREREALYNSAVLVDANGPVETYRKLHLFMNEKDFFTPGDRGLPVVERPYGRVGMQVCFDWAFPEAWRALAMQGADIIAHPSNLVLPGRCQRAIPIHAMLNRVFIITGNRIGTEGALTFTGQSIIASPAGEVLAEAAQDNACVITAVIDPNAAHDKMLTPRNHAFDDRRADVYGSAGAS